MFFRLFLFDLDGTLIDSKADIAASVNLALIRMKLGPVSALRIAEFVGNGVQILIERALREALGSDPGSSLLHRTIAVYLEEYEKHLLDSTRLYAGVEEVLNSLRWASLAIVTNKPEKFSRIILEGLGIAGRFCVILGGDSIPQRKPDPAPLQEIMNRCEIPPSETVMVGDSFVDIAAGKAAGVFTCGIAGGFRDREELEAAGCDLIVENISELAKRFFPP